MLFIFCCFFGKNKAILGKNRPFLGQKIEKYQNLEKRAQTGQAKFKVGTLGKVFRLRPAPDCVTEIALFEINFSYFWLKLAYFRLKMANFRPKNCQKSKKLGYLSQDMVSKRSKTLLQSGITI